jgi:hypothetical protein
MNRRTRKPATAPVVAHNLVTLSGGVAMRRDDGSDIDIAFHEAHLTLRDGTPVLIRRLVTEDALSRFYKPRKSRGSQLVLTF